MPRPGNRLRLEGLRRRDGRAAQARAGLLEGRLESLGQPRVSGAAADPVRRLSPDALHRMRGVGHHQGTEKISFGGASRLEIYGPFPLDKRGLSAVAFCWA